MKRAVMVVVQYRRFGWLLLVLSFLFFLSLATRSWRSWGFGDLIALEGPDSQNAIFGQV